MAGGQRDESENEVIFSDGQLVCMDQGWERIPSYIASSYGALVTRLDLAFNCIKSLELLDRFLSLEELVLDNNDISSLKDLPRLPKLHTLTLNKNKLTDIVGVLDQLETSCPVLSYLSLLGNEACPNQLSSLDKDDEDYQRYRYYVLYRLPKLKFLDSSTVSAIELKEAKKRGPFLKVVKPKDESEAEACEAEEAGAYSPLPKTLRDDDDHKATFGKCKYVYYGRHSEGNRFIRNNDL